LNRKRGINDMMKRSTTAKDLQKLINEYMVIVTSVTVTNKDTFEPSEITPEQFMNDFEWYMESGIFADSLDFKYELAGNNNIKLFIGYVSGYCDNCIDVVLQFANGATLDQVVDGLNATYTAFLASLSA